MYKNVFIKKVLIILMVASLLLTVGFSFGCNKDNDGKKEKPSSIYALSALQKTITIDEEYQLEVIGAKGESITWSVDDKRVASISENGLVKGVLEGSTKVYARVNGQVLSCEIIVKIKLVDYIEITLPNEADNQITLAVGGSYTFVPELTGGYESSQIVLTSNSASITINGFTITAVSKVENARLTFSCNLSGVEPLVVYVTVV